MQRLIVSEDRKTAILDGNINLVAEKIAGIGCKGCYFYLEKEGKCRDLVENLSITGTKCAERNTDKQYDCIIWKEVPKEVPKEIHKDNSFNPLDYIY